MEYKTVRNCKSGKIHAAVNGALVCTGSTDTLNFQQISGTDILTAPYLSRCEVCYKRINRLVSGDAKTRLRKAQDAAKLAAWEKSVS